MSVKADQAQVATAGGGTVMGQFEVTPDPAYTTTYDADGDLATEQLPGGYTLTATQDETGAETSRLYTQEKHHTRHHH
jgi:hypothetical protein